MVLTMVDLFRLEAREHDAQAAPPSCQPTTTFCAWGSSGVQRATLQRRAVRPVWLPKGGARVLVSGSVRVRVAARAGLVPRARQAGSWA